MTPSPIHILNTPIWQGPHFAVISSPMNPYGFSGVFNIRGSDAMGIVWI